MRRDHTAPNGSIPARSGRRRAAAALSVALAVLLPGAALAQTSVLSGRVTNSLGQPIVNVDLDFVVVATGDPFPTNNDVTNANGDYAVTVSQQVYDVFYEAPPGVPYAVHVLRNVNLTTNQVRNVVLEDVSFVSGTILRGDTGLPSELVDIDVIDLSTGQTLVTAGDHTNAMGQYTIAVPRGVYEVTFDRTIDKFSSARVVELSITAQGNVTLPTITLAPGGLVKGELKDGIGDGVAGADLDFVLAGTTPKIFALNDNTDLSGKYQVYLPPGNYDVKFQPPNGSPLHVKTRTGVVVSTSADVDLGIDIMADGWAVQGFVKDTLGGAVKEARLDVSRTVNGQPVPTTQNQTDAAGHYLFRLAPGTVDILSTAERNSFLNTHVRTSLGVFSNLTLPDTVLAFHDDDGDAIADRIDRCPFVSDASQPDLDSDGAGDPCDNCSSVSNARQENNDADALGDACDTDDDNDGVSDVSDPDLDGDTVANVTDNCPQARNRDQRNRDADAVGDACDPDDGEVEHLRAGNRTGWTWRPETGALGYQVYRHPLVWLTSVNYGTCFQYDLTARVFRDTETPGAAEAFAFVYLVTARTAAGEGSMGSKSDGVERLNFRRCP